MKGNKVSKRKLKEIMKKATQLRREGKSASEALKQAWKEVK